VTSPNVAGGAPPFLECGNTLPLLQSKPRRNPNSGRAAPHSRKNTGRTQQSPPLVADELVLRRTWYRPFGRPTHTLCYNPTMDEQSLAKQLREEGFSHTYVWEDGPGAHYADHTHPGQTAHIILTGEMTLTMAGRSQTYRSGDRCDVPASAVHSAHMGPKGCRYLIGER
jgi:hypothetical protein